MNKETIMEFVKKYTMIIVLLLVTGFFAWKTGGKILNRTERIRVCAGNRYVIMYPDRW